MDPPWGTVETLFHLDASGSSNPSDPNQTLEVRWDFESDGSWDTQWQTEKTTTHQYPVPGRYAALLEVRNELGLSDTTSIIADVSPRILWEVWIDNEAWGEDTPGIDDFGNIYLGCGGEIIVIDPAGNTLWSAAVEGHAFAPTLSGDGRLFASNYAGLSAFNTDGSLIWHYPSLEITQASVALGSDTTIYMGSRDRMIRAINPDGSLKWDYEAAYQIVAAPVIDGNGILYIGAVHRYYAFDPNGSVKWFRDFEDSFWQPAAIAVDGTLYVSTTEGTLYALDPLDGEVLWAFETTCQGTFSPVIAVDGTIYFCHGERIAALSPAGQLIWQKAFTNSPVFGATLAADGTVFVSVIGEENGGLVALDPSGSIKWIARFPYGVRVPPVIGPDGTLYVQPYQVEWVYAIDAQCGGLAQSPWPKFQYDSANTGRRDY